MNSLNEIDKKDLMVSLRRIEGQIKGIRKMIKNDKYCADILTQINAARGGLKQVGINVLAQHIHGCVKRTIQKRSGEETIDELTDILGKFTDKKYDIKESNESLEIETISGATVSSESSKEIVKSAVNKVITENCG